ncbi:MAG: hypothetical protein E6J90_29510 [Deltaproteobacteria bacterium]|nr:MAG: hypothetical protein E6J90_29510 [Deltaproteobacteria bacterium]
MIVLHRENNAIRSAVIVEIQLGTDRTKRRSWPVYVTTVRARLDCSTVLLVLTSKGWIARWARRPIDTGHPGFILVPVVLDFHDLPRIIDPKAGRKLPELAVLSAMAHRDLDVASAAIAAISRLPEDRKRLYLTAILTELPFELRRVLEDGMKRELVERYFERKSFAQGRSAGRSEGRKEGRMEGLRAAVLVLARARLDALTTADEAAITALQDESALSALIGALDGARSRREARAAIRAAIASAD